MVRGKLWAVVEREYLERVRNRWFLIGTFFGPIVFGAILFLPTYLASKREANADVARIRIVDATGTQLGQRISAALNGGVMGDTSLTQVVRVSPAAVTNAERDAERAVTRGEFKGYLLVDGRTLAGQRAHYVGTNATVIPEVDAVRAALRRGVLAERLDRAGLDAAEVERLVSLNVQLRAERLTTAGGRGGSGRLNALFAIIVSALLYMTIFLYGQAVLRGVIEEKQSRVAEVVVASISPTRLLTGKVLGVGAVGLTQMLIWIATGALMLRLREAVLARLGVTTAPLVLPYIEPGMLVLLLFFFLLGYLFYASLFAAVGAMVSTEQEAQQAQLPVAMLLVLSIAFLQPALEAPDSTLAVNLSMLPFSSPILMPLRMSTVAVPGWQIGLAIFELVLACVVAVWLAARIYRIGLLMYGKRPTLREVFRWVRAS